MKAAPKQSGSRVLSLGVAVALSSAIGVGLLAIIGRLLSPSDYGLFVAFWGVMFGLASSLSTVEQEAARQTAETAAPGESPIRRVALAAGLIATTFAALTLLPPISSRLYGDPNSPLGLLVVLTTVGFSFQFVVRGVLIGAGHVRSYAGLLIVEAGSRLLLLLAVWATIGLTLGTAAAAVAVGAFAWIFWGPRVLALTKAAPSTLRDGPPSWRAPFSRAASLMVAAGLTASLITGYPAVVAFFADGDPGAAVGAVFAALTVSRVPLLFVAPLQALAVPTVVRWRQDRSSRNPRAIIVKALAITFFAACVGSVATWFLGPWAVTVVYGPKYIVTPGAVAGLAFSACILGLLQLLSAALIAFESYRSMIIVWSTALVSTVVWLFFSPLSLVTSTVVGAVVGPVAGVIVGVLALWKLAKVPTAPTSGPLSMTDLG